MPRHADELTELYRAHRAEVIRLCRHLLGSDRAEDAAQDVFLKAYHHRDACDASRPFLPWILGIASHHCIDVLRRRAMEGRLFGSEDVERAAMASAGTSPLLTLIARERQRELAAAISALPTRYRVPLVLSIYREQSYEDIGATLAIPKSHVAVLIFRAKQLLRNRLAPVSRSFGGTHALS